MNKGLVMGGAIFLVLALAVFAAFGGGSEPLSDAPAFADVTVSGTPLPVFDNPSADLAIGMAAPVVTGVDLDGNPVTIGDPNEPTIIMFLAHWCSHCQREVPRVTRYLEENEVDGISFQAVATGSDASAPNFPPGEWLAREEWPVVTMLDDTTSNAGAAYGLSAFPFWVIIDGDGVVQARFSGEVPEAEFVAILDRTASLGG